MVAWPVPSNVAVPMVVAPSLRVTRPVGVLPAPETVTLTELALPCVDGSGAWTAVTVAAALFTCAVTAPLAAA